MLRLPIFLQFLTFIAVTTRRRDVNRKLLGIFSDSIVTLGTVRRVTTLFQSGTFFLRRHVGLTTRSSDIRKSRAVEVRSQCQVSPCQICCGLSGTGICFPPNAQYCTH
jgi:hypothetical protein